MVSYSPSTMTCSASLSARGYPTLKTSWQTLLAPVLGSAWTSSWILRGPWLTVFCTTSKTSSPSQYHFRLAFPLSTQIWVGSSASNQPSAVVLDLPMDNDLYASFAPDDAPLALPSSEARQPYQPAEAFFVFSSLPSFLDSVTSVRKLSSTEDGPQTPGPLLPGHPSAPDRRSSRPVHRD